MRRGVRTITLRAQPPQGTGAARSVGRCHKEVAATPSTVSRKLTAPPVIVMEVGRVAELRPTEETLRNRARFTAPLAGPNLIQGILAGVG
jgi:hypothetical protein